MDHDGIDAVLFDLDGVITPTAEKHMQAWKRMFTAYFADRGIAPYSDSDYFHYIDGKPRVEGIASMLAARGITLPEGDDEDSPDADTINGLGQRKNIVFRELLDEGIEPYPGSVAYLDALDAAGIASCVVSSSKNARPVLEAAGLLDRFEVIVDGLLAQADRIPGKPRPDTYLRAAELLGVPAGRCAVIEDAVSGVQAGAAGGFARVVGVDRGAGREVLLREGADIVVDDLADLIPGLTEARS
ncbi:MULTISPECIES: HAD family hydrolase [unclassified Dietzia]|uniref:HAD family hydrolase n=1 Tax=unclassified Dietzia TaxID=2617939 RepID=UPI0015FB9089|nr:MULTISPECIES: beta-phosphoglucomutase family hydrolase [unclassified Dietzia]MBB1023672.1 beta-phosphoglucomutase family hydrolase [Dietzia sp. DQ12-76]MBB1026422.1 beta-phosphoglucomutase family hydrolase [Dietzia sp. DQ11-38-2]